MTYKECLKVIRDNNLNVLQLQVAVEVNEKLGQVISRYEDVCKFIYTCATQTNSVSVDALCRCFYGELMNNGNTEEELLEMREYNFIEIASYY